MYPRPNCKKIKLSRQQQHQAASQAEAVTYGCPLGTEAEALLLLWLLLLPVVGWPEPPVACLEAPRSVRPARMRTMWIPSFMGNDLGQVSLSHKMPQYKPSSRQFLARFQRQRFARSKGPRCALSVRQICVKVSASACILHFVTLTETVGQ